MRRIAKRLRTTCILALAGTAALGIMSPGVAAARDRSPEQAQPTSSAGCEEHGCIRSVEVSGLIDPIVADHISRTVAEAQRTPGVRAVLLTLNSAGAVIDGDRLDALAKQLVDSPVPVSVWIGPSGAKALGGASELVAVLDDVSASPGSEIGEMGDQRLDPARFGEIASGSRVEMATRRYSAEEALAAGIIDRIAPTGNSHLIGMPGVDVTDVIDQDGKTVKQPQTVLVIGKLPLPSQLLHTMASPAVAYLLLAVALGLLIFEFFTAGVGIAGIIGAGALLGAGYGLGVLPVRPWAVALCVLAAIAFSFDIAVGVPRAWTAIGMAMWVAGSVVLFDGVGLPWFALLVGVLGMAVAMVSGMPAMVRARFGTPTIGREHLIGTLGRATSAIAPEGTVDIDGSPWRAMTNRLTPIALDDHVRVVAIDGLTLEVEPLEGAAKDYREMRSKDRRSESEEPA